MCELVRRLATGVVIVSLTASARPPATPLSTPQPNPTAPSQTTSGFERLRQYAETLPPGSTVTVVFTTGVRLTGTLVDVEPTSIIVRPKTRVPEPQRAIAFADVAALKPAASGLTTLQAMAIGAAIGAGAVISVLLILVAHS
jgi:hypothetical protein